MRERESLIKTGENEEMKDKGR